MNIGGISECESGGISIAATVLLLYLLCTDFWLIKTHNLPPNRNYIFGYHPHGIFCFGAFCNFSTEATGFSQKFPGIKPSLATLAGNFRLPLLRDYLMSGGEERRLRHLRSIAARNIVNRNHSPLLDTYFTLHLCSDNRISKDFYKSEVIRDSLSCSRPDATLKHAISHFYPDPTLLLCPIMHCLVLSFLCAAKDDGSVAVALGYTAHLVLMISCFLQIPLSDRHHVSSSIPVPVRSNLSVSQVAFPVSPDADKKKRRPYKLYDPVVTPPPDATVVQEAPPDRPDTSMESEETLEADSRAEAAGTSTPEPKSDRFDPNVETYTERHEELAGEPRESELVEEESPQHPGAINGSAGIPGTAEVCCSVEQAEEIMGTEATGLGSRLEDFPCIPVEHAVAVESDDQVLGELENFQEFSKRIYALSENPSCFRRPRKNSDK
ncbi:Diacylglycerol O-acyltransferase 2 [Bagarius yarrelli]|uniref:Acyltransferase n=1 Tax=Bagarius yarrelli TaxID=175774 RepID=A0A556VUU3_BAGYA|nr:Diacylglycerol O-acyltransferase 2 [Bagarius yarrelli]